MAYTRAWSDIIPAGSRRAGDVDDAMREIRVDVHERMTDLVVDWTADPVVLKPEYKGNVVGAQLMFGPHILQHRQDEHDTDWVIQYVEANDSGDGMYGQIVMPVGVIITLFEAWLDKNTSASASITLRSVVASTGVSTVITGPLTRSIAGIGIVTSAVLAKTVINTEFLSVEFFGASGGGPRCHGMRVTYTRANNLQAY